MQTSLIQAQELGDEKMQIVTQLQELIDHKTRQLDTDQKNLDIKEEPNDIKMEDDYGAIIPIKQTRTQSPARSGEQMSGAGVLLSNGWCNFLFLFLIGTKNNNFFRLCCCQLHSLKSGRQFNTKI